MRISSAVLGLAFVAGFASPAFAAESPFVGKWTAIATTPGGPVSETITVVKTVDGYAIEAKLVAPTPGQTEGGPGHDIVLDGDHFTYKRTVSIGGTEIVLTYTGVVAGDKFTATAGMDGLGTVPYTGVRIKDGA